MIKLAVIFGGMSTEHYVSIVSGTSIIKNLDKSKYEIYPIYIDEVGNWFEYIEKIDNIPNFEVGDKLEKIVPIENIMEYLRKIDCIFPALHGLYGEDGTVQGLFELLKIPYVGCKVLSSSISMDKAYTKVIFNNAKIDQAKYIYIKKDKNNYILVDDEFNERIYNLEEISKIVIEKLKFPMFIKPSNSGSSVGINKSKNMEDLKQHIEYASKFDKKILIEQGIDGKEVECAVLGNEDVISSCIGEIVSAEEFYSFDSKYKNIESITIIPADISQEKSEELKKLAIKAFKAVDGKGLSRVDFFIEKETEKIYINEINTMPGFTKISMYPKLFEQSGITYSELLDKLIEISIE